MEKRLWNRLKRGCPAKMVRVEPRYPPGLPDVAWTYRGQSGWLELKSGVYSVRPEQAIFLRSWTEAGGLAWLLAEHPTKEEVVLVFGSSIPIDCRIPWGEAVARWETIHPTELAELLPNAGGIKK